MFTAIEQLTIKNVLFNDARLDYISEDKIGIIDDKIDKIIIGRALERLSGTDAPIIEKESTTYIGNSVIPVRSLWRHAEGTLNDEQQVFFQQDFLPEILTVGGKNIKSLARGFHNISAIEDLVARCRCMCDVVFHNIRLENKPIGHVQTVEFSCDAVTLHVVSPIVIVDTGVYTGCPNYG